MSVTNTLEERGSRYGAFADHAIIAQGIQDTMRAAPKWDHLDADMKQALSVIADKIARILNGDPFYHDNWHDIQGYAKLIEDRIHMIVDEPEALYPVNEEPSETPDAPWVGKGELQIPISMGWPSDRPNPNIRNKVTVIDGKEYVPPHDKANDPNYDVGNYRG